MRAARQRKLKRPWLLWLNLGLALASAACLLALLLLAGRLDTQKEAERWKGESELEFRQLSCFLPIDEKLGLSDVFAFRYAILDKIHEASLDVDNDGTLFVDAWSTSGKAAVSTHLGKGDARITAVGGAFFQFHPLRLISGSYIAEGDLMQDRVLLDEELAWLLYGGANLSGMEVRINGKPFQVVGVIEREQDFASRRAYTDGMGLYMSYDAYKELEEDAGISCYEVVMPNPVRNFAINFAREKFPIGNGVIVENTNRFRFGKLLDVMTQFGKRTMQNRGILYPYWENAARCIEDWCTLLMLLSILLAVTPAVSLVRLIQRTLKRGKEKLADDLLPEWKDSVEESIRVRQRRRWEKRHATQK